MTAELDRNMERLREVTERLEELEWEQLRQKASLALAGLLTYSLEPIIVVSPRNRILDLNYHAKVLFGHAQDDALIRRPARTLFREADQWLIIQDEYKKRPRSHLLDDITALRSDNGEMKVSLFIHPLLIETHLVIVVVCQHGR